MVIDDKSIYEERITLWRASDIDEAIERAETEGQDYADSIDAEYLNIAQAFNLGEAPGDAGEVFSLMRESDLLGEEYLNTFFDTGRERETELK